MEAVEFRFSKEYILIIYPYTILNFLSEKLKNNLDNIILSSLESDSDLDNRDKILLYNIGIVNPLAKINNMLELNFS